MIEIEGQNLDVSDLSTRGRSFLRMMNIRWTPELLQVEAGRLWPRSNYRNVGPKTAKELILWARRHRYEFAGGVPPVPRARPRCPTCGRLRQMKREGP